MEQIEPVTEGRRNWLKASSLSLLAFVSACTGGTTRSRGEVDPLAPTGAEEAYQESESCEDTGVRPTCREESDEFKQAKQDLWAQYYEGIKAWPSGQNTELEPGLAAMIESERGQIICRKWHLWLRCEDQTKDCCWMAGMLSESYRVMEGGERITRQHFQRAVRTVQIVQKRRLNSSFIGIAC